MHTLALNQLDKSSEYIHSRNTVWHENLTVIKFYGLSKFLKYKKSTYFQILQQWK